MAMRDQCIEVQAGSGCKSDTRTAVNPLMCTIRIHTDCTLDLVLKYDALDFNPCDMNRQIIAGWLAGWLAWLAGWLSGWLVGKLAGWLAAWLAGCMPGDAWLTRTSSKTIPKPPNTPRELQEPPMNLKNRRCRCSEWPQNVYAAEAGPRFSKTCC